MQVLLKVALVWLVFASGLCSATAQTGEAGSPLREELSRLLEQGRAADAIQRVQEAVKRNPSDAGARTEFVELHMSLARRWLADRRFDDCQAALDAILGIEPRNGPAKRMRDEIAAAREKAGTRAAQIDRLLRMELFESALDEIRAVKVLLPGQGDVLKSQERAAWLGAADDHYLARNFNEAFALYENLLSINPESPADIHSRWAVALALAVAEDDAARPAEADAAAKLLARAIDVLRRTNEPVLGQVIGGLLAQRAGKTVEAGAAYALALGELWTLPPADRRREVITGLRKRAIARARDLYETIQPPRRAGFWGVALDDVWKVRQTDHFEVRARSDLVAERISEALEFHFDAISKWLELPAGAEFSPKCEIRVYEDLERLHKETGTSGVTRAVSRTRIQGGQVLLRQVSVFQSDHWLLSSTLPHELTHILIAERLRGISMASSQPARVPVAALAVDEGMAVQAEPPARRLQYRRLLDATLPAPAKLLSVDRIVGDQLAFYAGCDALTEFLLRRKGVTGLLEYVAAGNAPGLSEHFGWMSEAAMLKEWRDWHETRRKPARMPLMILTEPELKTRKKP